jgi:predicted nucleotidyltransferase/DNA-binding transcriptional ArsR family regulator
MGISEKPRRPARVHDAASKSRRTSLADALFTGTQQRVLRLLFGQPERSFFATEIISLAAGGSGAVQRELARLEESGLVTSTRVGNQKHYQANKASPIFDELATIVRRTFGLYDPLRFALTPIEKQIAFAMVYGSVAKGADTAASDIDLLVVSDDLKLEQLFKTLEPVERDLGRRINPTLYTTSEFNRRRRSQDGFVARVLKDDHIVLTGDIDGAQTT